MDVVIMVALYGGMALLTQTFILITLQEREPGWFLFFTVSLFLHLGILGYYLDKYIS